MGDRILVVDDDPDILQYVKMNLELEGFETETASNGADALQAASANPPSLVLLDVMMPGMDGLTTLRHLRNDPPTASVPVVMLTARALAQDRVKGLDLGADDYITKPFAVEELVARVRTVIRRAQQMRDVSPLTGLPGNFRIAGELERRISEQVPIAVVYGDLDNFKAFNDHYGFMRGDTVIKFTAKVMMEAAASTGGEDAFVGHVGGDDYIALIDPELVDEYCSTIIQEFDDGILDFYDTVDAVQRLFLNFLLALPPVALVCLLTTGSPALSWPGLLGGLVLGLVLMAAIQHPLLRWLRPTPLPLVVAAALLIMPVALLIQLLLQRRRAAPDLHVAHLLEASPHRRLRRRAVSIDWVRSRRPLFWAAALLIYQLFSDVTLASLLAPVRMPLVMPRLYNFMHYGRSEVLTASLLITLLVPLAALGLAGLTYRSWRSWHAASLDA